MSELIEYLSECDEVSLANIEAFVNEKKTQKRKRRVLSLVSTAISEKLVGPPANQVLTEEQFAQYELDMEECMKDGTWDDINKLKTKLAERQVDNAIVSKLEASYPA